MTFVSLVYGAFVVLSLIIYWGVTRYYPQLRIWLLLGSSIAFYYFLQAEYIPLLLVGALINWWFGKMIAKQYQARDSYRDKIAENSEYWRELQDFWNGQSTQILIFGILLNVTLLLLFKYVPFVLQTLNDVVGLPWAQTGAMWVDQNLIVPLGISFFTFENIAYLIDVYRGAPASKNAINYISYKLFFPKLISGPITRYHSFVNEIAGVKFPSIANWSEGLWLIAFGAVKKVLIADRLGILVELAFSNIERAGSGDLWVATIAYGLQLYLDFSGYVDMARGTAKLFAIDLPQNFDFPYFSESLAVFWRRWHITLGDWLRNYLYFPLGGSRQGLVRTCLNLFTVMAIAGLWHGASWGYILWGVIHGMGLILHRLTKELSDRYRWLERWWRSVGGIVCGWVLTQGLVFLAWIPFRLPNLKESSLVYSHLWSYAGDAQFVEKVYGEGLGLEREYVILLMIMVMALMGLSYLVRKIWQLRLNWPVQLILVPIVLYCVWLFAPEGDLPYIYFDF